MTLGEVSKALIGDQRVIVTKSVTTTSTEGVVTTETKEIADYYTGTEPALSDETKALEVTGIEPVAIGASVSAVYLRLKPEVITPVMPETEPAQEEQGTEESESGESTGEDVPA